MTLFMFAVSLTPVSFITWTSGAASVIEND